MDKYHSTLWLFFLLVLLTCCINYSLAQAPQWTFNCVQGKCVREQTTGAVTPLDVCRLNCDTTSGSLLPKPRQVTQLGTGLTDFYTSNVNFFHNQDPDFSTATTIFVNYLNMMGTDFGTEYQTNTVQVTIIYTDSNKSITLSTNETYSLEIIEPAQGQVSVEIRSANYYGARHALETLSQLIAYDSTTRSLKIVNQVSIWDAPVYPYRGVMLDTARNYYSVNAIKRLIDGLSYNKLNMFHWHLTDSQSFPMEVAGRPEFTQYGAYSPQKVYTADQMIDIVNYARVRGVKVVPEFDQPAHVGLGWGWAPQENPLTVCVNKQPWENFCLQPTCGQFNVANPTLYDEIRIIYQSMLAVFDNDLFHMGGDEVHFGCWESETIITDWMAEQGISIDEEGFIQVWGNFTQQSHQALVTANGGNPDIESILWTSELTKLDTVEQYLNSSDFIIQIWTDEASVDIRDLLRLGYRTIFSNYDRLYLDCGFSAWIGNDLNWCAPYKSWQKIYSNDPFALYAALSSEAEALEAWNNGLFLGAETPLWSEQSDESVFESKVFPRASAHAERLWTIDPTTTKTNETSYIDLELRLATHRERMVGRGIMSDAVTQEYCRQTQNGCEYVPPVSAPEPENPISEATNSLGSKVTLMLIAVYVILTASY